MWRLESQLGGLLLQSEDGPSPSSKVLWRDASSDTCFQLSYAISRQCASCTFIMSKWKEWWGRDKGGEAARLETALSRGTECQPGRWSWPPTQVHPWSQGSTVPTLRAPPLPIYFELQGNQLIRLEEVPYSEAIWLGLWQLIDYKDWVDRIQGTCVHQQDFTLLLSEFAHGLCLQVKLVPLPVCTGLASKFEFFLKMRWKTQMNLLADPIIQTEVRKRAAVFSLSSRAGQPRIWVLPGFWIWKKSQHRR